MSRLAKKPITLFRNVIFEQKEGEVFVSGPIGQIKLKLLPKIVVKIENGNIWVNRVDDDKQSKANQGTMWSLIKNAVLGVTDGFAKVLEIEGIGYRAALEGKDLLLYLGYVNPVKVEIPPELKVEVEKGTIIKIFGSNKELVGQMAAKIRSLKKPEPYKGKGIRYQGEVIRRKAGKKAAGAGGGSGG